MLYRMNKRVGAAGRLLGLPVLGMMLAISISSTKAWAPADIAAPSEPVIIVIQ